MGPKTVLCSIGPRKELAESDVILKSCVFAEEVLVKYSVSKGELELVCAVGTVSKHSSSISF